MCRILHFPSLIPKLTLYVHGCVGGGHPGDPGPPSGGQEHHRDAGHHGSGSPAGGGPLRDGRVGAVRPHPAGAAGALQQHQAAVCQQGQNSVSSQEGEIHASSFAEFLKTQLKLN